MLWVARPIYLRQTQDGTRQLGVAQDHSLNQDLLVAVRQVGWLSGCAIWIQGGPKWRVFGERLWVRQAILQAKKPTIGAINIHAADGDHTAGYAAKGLHDERSLLLHIRKHVQDNIGHKAPELGSESREISAITADVRNNWRQVRRRLSSMEQDHNVPLAHEASYNPRADETGAPNDENTHGFEKVHATHRSPNRQARKVALDIETVFTILNSVQRHENQGPFSARPKESSSAHRHPDGRTQTVRPRRLRRIFPAPPGATHAVLPRCPLSLLRKSRRVVRLSGRR